MGSVKAVTSATANRNKAEKGRYSLPNTTISVPMLQIPPRAAGLETDR